MTTTNKEKTRTITFQPDPVVKSLLAKAARRHKGVRRSWIINHYLAEALSDLRGKREAAV